MRIENWRRRSEGKKIKENLAAIDGVLILKNLIKNGRIREDDKAKATGTASGLVAHNNGLNNFPKLGEIVPKLLLGGVPSYSTNEKLPLVGVHVSDDWKSAGIWGWLPVADEFGVIVVSSERSKKKREKWREGNERQSTRREIGARVPWKRCRFINII